MKASILQIIVLFVIFFVLLQANPAYDSTKISEMVAMLNSNDLNPKI